MGSLSKLMDTPRAREPIPEPPSRAEVGGMIALVAVVVAVMLAAVWMLAPAVDRILQDLGMLAQ